MTRDAFEEILGAMARANFLRLVDAVFEKDGKSIPYRKAGLTPDGEALEQIVEGDLLMKDAAQAATKARKSRKKKAAAPAAKGKRSRTSAAVLTPAPPRPADRPKLVPDSKLEDALRLWRLGEAKRRGVPAFRIFSDQALKAVAARRPATAAELLAIPGLGISTVEKYGAQIYRLLHGTG
jgi:superfamily II DNA helicase RecQ